MESAEIQAALRSGLRRLAKAVVIISCKHEDRRYAMAATAVSELSMEPPSLLVCVNRGASISAPLTAGADFAINILHSSHEAIATLCSGAVKGEARFVHGRWIVGPNGIPLIEDAQANFLCRNSQSFAFGTHDVFIGEVFETAVHGDIDPLIYVDGRYVNSTKV
jgi:flavin reductase (DIM6/NTAB) family NADH-FMN oxidoreductase RutF